MDFLSFNFIAFLVFISLIFLTLKGRNKSKSLQKLPPGPPSLPLIGQLHHLFGDIPHRALAKLAKKYGPFMHLKLGEVSFVVISSREHAKEVLKVQDPKCADRPTNLGATIVFYEYKDIAFSMYDEYWRQMRKICIVELLSAKNVRSFNSIRRDEALRLVSTIKSSSGKPINLTEEIGSFSNLVTCRAAFGQILDDREEMINGFKEGLAMAGGFDLSDLFPSSKFFKLISWNRYRLLKIRGKLDVILDRIIQEHRDTFSRTGKGKGEKGGEDIVDVLLRIKDKEELQFPIGDDHIKAIIYDMFSAGTETSSTTADWAMAELLRNPHVMKKVQSELREALKGKKTVEESDIQDLKYLKFVIKETLRMHPPIVLLPRACREECEVDGYNIPLKAKVAINVWAIGRDPKYWTDPESFKPERFEDNSVDFLGNNFEFLPFGAGKRICPGMNFGLANVELPLAQLLYHFDWKLPQGMSPNDVDMTEVQALAVSRKNSLFAIPIPYNPTSEA